MFFFDEADVEKISFRHSEGRPLKGAKVLGLFFWWVKMKYRKLPFIFFKIIPPAYPLLPPHIYLSDIFTVSIARKIFKLQNQFVGLTLKYFLTSGFNWLIPFDL